MTRSLVFRGKLPHLLAVLLLAGCSSVPRLDRDMLRSERTPVRLEGAHGPMSHARSLQILEELKKRSPDSGILERHVAVEERLTDNPLSAGNQVKLLEDGKAAYPAMLAAIRGARSSVHVETYIFEADDVGREFANALIERARAGVKVRVMYDSVGSIDTPRDFFQPMRDAGVEVVEYNPVKPEKVLTEGLRLNHRDHRKLTIVDGRVAFLGGINISSVYTPSRGSSGGSAASGGTSTASGTKKNTPYPDKPWRDTAVQLEGPVVTDLQRGFVEMWEGQKKQKLATAGLFPKVQPTGRQVVRAIDSLPEQGPNPAYVTLISAIESAEKSVHITIAYFVPHPELLAALGAAAQRGVDVRLILPSKTDSRLVLAAGRSYYEDLLEAGVKIHERRARLLHAKTAVIDGVWSTVGSTNLDWRSLTTNAELNAVVLGPEFGEQMEASFQHDIAESDEITREKWAARPFTDRLREQAARTWALML